MKNSMNMKKKFVKLLYFSIVIGVFGIACDKIEELQPQSQLEIAQDNAIAEKATGDVFAFINSGTTSPAKTSGDCPVITLNLQSKVVTISFPEGGCTGPDGITRAGIITAAFDQNFQGTWQVNNTATVNFDNYKVDGRSLEGTMNITCSALEPYPVFEISSADMVLTFTDQRSISWSFETSYTMLDGFPTKFDRTDDVWEITGTSNGTTRGGKSFERIATALTTKNSCKYFVAGTLETTLEETDYYKIEFSEPCGSIIITYKGIELPYTLP
jgi:hypothetical protein